MKKFGLILPLIVAVFFTANLKAEGLPANPWLNQPVSPTVSSQQPDFSDQVSEAATDIWSKVRDTKDFRQWRMTKHTSEVSESQNTDEKQNLLTMLENLNRVGYFLPDNYKNIIKQMPTAQKAAAPQKTEYSDSFKKLTREWQAKYRKTKANSLNVLDNSYHRALATIKRATGVDVKRAIDNSINALK